MRIKCPSCSTAYNVPDDKIGAKPVKMRCSQCKTVFAVTRRSDAPPPPGYDEFTGPQSHLPREFAFLEKTEDEKTHEDKEEIPIRISVGEVEIETPQPAPAATEPSSPNSMVNAPISIPSITE